MPHLPSECEKSMMERVRLRVEEQPSPAGSSRNTKMSLIKRNATSISKLKAVRHVGELKLNQKFFKFAISISQFLFPIRLRIRDHGLSNDIAPIITDHGFKYRFINPQCGPELHRGKSLFVKKRLS